MPNTAVQYSLAVQQTLSREFRQIAGDTQALSREMAALAHTLEGTLDTGTQGAGRLNKELQGLHTTAQRAGGVFKDVFGANLASAAVGKITGGIVDLGKASLDLVGNLESDTSALEGLTGSSTAAQKQLADFAVLAAKTSFNQQDVVKYAVQLEGVGVAGNKVVPTLRSIADALAGVGRGADPEKLNAVAQAYLKIQTQGRAQADELLSFAEAGIPIYDLLAKTLGKSTGEITRMAEAGQLTAQVFDQAFDTGVQQRWQGAAEKSSQTLQGIISNAQDVGDQFLTILGKAAVASSGLEGRLGAVVTYLQNPQAKAAVEHLGAELGVAAGYAFDLVGSLGKLLGLPPLDIPPPPDFSKAAGDAGTLAGNLAGASLNLQSGEDYAGQLSHDIEAAHNQATQLARVQAAADQDAAAHITKLRDAALVQDRIYDDQLTKLRGQADQIDRAYQIQQNQRALSRASTKLGDDRLLALDLSSNAGAAAADRLPDEEIALQDLRDKIRQDDAKAAIKSDEDRVQGAKQAYDRQVQDTQQAAERLAAAVHAASQTQIDDFNATAEALRKLQDVYAGKDLDPAITEATNRYSQFYTHTLPDIISASTQQAGDDITTRYQTVFGTTLPDIATAASTKIFAALLGTDADWQGRGTAAGSAFITGFGDGLRDSPNDTLKFLGDIARGDWAAAAKDYPLVKTIGDTGKNLAGALGAQADTRIGQSIPPGPPAMADPNRPGWVDVGPTPGNWRYDPARWEQLTGRKMPGASSAPTGATQTGGSFGPDLGPGLGDVYRQYYGGGRANGGPVLPGGTYPVGEYGPETLFMGAGGGYVVPDGAGAGGPARVEVTVKHLCPVCLRSEVEQVIDARTQSVSQTQAGYIRNRRR